MQFDYKAGWGTDAFEDSLPEDHQFPEAWLSIDDRYDAREIIEEQFGRLEWAAETVGGDLFDPCPPDWTPEQPDGLEIEWENPTYCNYPGGRRGGGQDWWLKFLTEAARFDEPRFVWCQFNVEGFRLFDPHPLEVPGWLVWPRYKRTPFVWGGPDMKPAKGKPRLHGQPATSPGNCAVWWSSVEPAPTPYDSIVTRTGV